jgi:indoleamine 2,3-dioxygenase
MSPGHNRHHVISTLKRFDIDPERGFLSSLDPCEELPPAFRPWEEIAFDLPKLLAAGRLRTVLKKLPVIDSTQLQDTSQDQRAMLLLSYFGHGYVWGDAEPADHIPAGVAVPWEEVAKRLGRPPVLSYASYALSNWRRLDHMGPISLGNIVLLQNFLGGIDEEWFILVHVDIEAKAAPALSAMVQAQQAVLEDLPGELLQHLTTMAGALEEIYGTLLRMPEHCDPYIYFHRVRPYIHGWKDHPAIPQGITYEGVTAYGGRPRQFRGETGAQSSIIPSLDAALGVVHKDDPLRPYLMEMREYMPPQHRAFIEAIENGPSVRKYVLENSQKDPVLRDAYNECVHCLERFRSKHLEYASRYVHKQSLQSPYNPTGRGTGGTPFVPYLKKHRDETSEHLITK